jgi:hypothetical protein
MQAAEFSFKQQQYETEIAHLSDLEGSLRTKLASLEAQRSALAHRYDVDVKLQSEKVKTDNHKLAEAAARWKGKAKSAEDEIQVLKAQLSARRKSEGPVVDDEAERTRLSELLNLTRNDWPSIAAKVKQVISDNDTLRTRIAASGKPRWAPPVSVGDCHYPIDSFVPEVRAAANAILRSQYSALVDRQNFLIAKQLGDLHTSIFNSEKTVLRSVVLLVVFLGRLRRAPDAIIDPRALLLFEGKPEFSPAVKLHQIRSEVLRLTTDLAVAKQNLLEIGQAKRELEAKLTRKEAEVVELQNASVAGKAQVIALKGRLLTLMEDLSTLISPEQYKELEGRFDLAVSVREGLEAEIEALRTEVTKRTEMASAMSKKRDKSIIARQIAENREGELREICSQRDEQLESLQALLRERTKEILALERLVSRQAQAEKKTNAQLSSLAVENQQLLQNCGPEQATQRSKGLFINPVFLGQ